jgi:hypothetical protein
MMGRSSCICTIRTEESSMAGGPFARLAACPTCTSRAVRTYEGKHEDRYRCDEGHVFHIAWSRFSAPTAPEWPPPGETNVLFGRNRSLGAH